MSDSLRVRELIDVLGLHPHPERGYFVETYRSTVTVEASSHDDPRVASTAIYYLMTAKEPASRLHRLLSDEVFHLYEGGPLDILCLYPDGTHATLRLGLALSDGERPQWRIPAGTWFGTELTARASHCLVGCTVAPGFEFADFELADADALAARYPDIAAEIRRMAGP